MQPGTTKTINGRTYRLNQNHRWEAVEDDRGKFEYLGDARGLTSEHIAYNPRPYWVQSHAGLLRDAMKQWKSDVGSLQLHMLDEIRNKALPDSGGAKIDRARAAALLHALRRNSQPAPRLYRGDSKDPATYREVAQSWTTSRRTAEKFAKRNGGKVYVLDSAMGIPAPGMGENEWIVLSWYGKNRKTLPFEQATKRVSELTKLRQENADLETYAEAIDRYKPVTEYESVPPLMPESSAIAALKEDARQYFGVPRRQLSEGDDIGLRLDIPAFTGSGVGVVAVHRPRTDNERSKEFHKAGPRIGYELAAHISDATFGVHEMAEDYATGKRNKSTFAVMRGRWKDKSAEECHRVAEAALNDPEWIQVGMDPERHQYFYPRGDHRKQILSADEVVQVGLLVFAKNPTTVANDDPAHPVRFGLRMASYDRRDSRKVSSLLDRIIGRSLIGAEGAAAATRARILRILLQKRHLPVPRILQAIRDPILRFDEFAYRHLANYWLYAWVSGIDGLYRKLPAWLAREIQTTIRRDPPPQKPPTPPFPRFTFYDDSDNGLRFLLIEKAAERLAKRNVMTRAQWEAASEDIKDRAFFITAPIATDTIDHIRHALVYEIDTGTSLGGFEKAVEETLGGSPLAPHHLETVYRTNLQAAFRDGRETLASNPIVADVFPYQAYDAIRDGRVRHDHLKMESLGLDGTNVFRRDDPVWDYFTPPWDYNCRCGVNLLTIEAAARAGVREAKEWLRTGKPPISPEFRIAEVLKQVRPNPNFGSRGLVYA